MIHRRAFLLGLAGAGLAGCGGGGKSDGPPKISYGKENCARCRMMIADERYAAALVNEDGAELHFDDTGELVLTVQEEGASGKRIWVHDYNTREWLDGTAAFYVMDPRRITPMATGIISFASRESADEFVASIGGGTIYTWQEVQSTWKSAA